MNSVKLQDTTFIYRNLFHIYALITNYQKETLRKQSHLQLHQKITRNKFNQVDETPVP